MDGTLITVRDRSVAASSRNYRFSANVQVFVDPDARLVVAAARPVPGATADAHAWRASGFSEHRRVRARMEHVIGRMKNYKILRDCRQRGDGLHYAVQAVAHMHNPALASCGQGVTGAGRHRGSSSPTAGVRTS